jgi:hypothetical protein
MGWGVVDRTDMAQGKDKWWVFLKAVINFRDPQNEGNFLTT